MTLSEQVIGLHYEFAQIHNFYISVVAAGPQANLSYVEQAPFVTHPAPLVVQVDRTAEQAESVIRVIGNRVHVRLTHEFETELHAQVTFFY